MKLNIKIDISGGAPHFLTVPPRKIRFLNRDICGKYPALNPNNANFMRKSALYLKLVKDIGFEMVREH